MINQANDKSTKTNNKVRSTTGSRVGAVGSTMTGNQLKSSMKTNTLVSANKKKGMNVAGKFAKNAVRAGGRLLWPVAAIMGAFDAASGVANAGELLDKEDGELTTRDKASAGFAGFLSGLTFGLVDKEKTAKYLAGDREPVEIDNSLETRKKYRHGMRTDQTKLDTVEELKADKIDKLSIGEGTAGNTIINNNVDTSNTTNKTEYGSTNIGTKNADSTVTDYSNIN